MIAKTLFRLALVLVLVFPLVPLRAQSTSGRIELQRASLAPAPLAFGTVTLVHNGATERIQAFAQNGLPDSEDDSLGVFIADAPGSTNLVFVRAMTLVKPSPPAKVTWELDLVGKGGAPTGLAIAHVEDLAGRLVELINANTTNSTQTTFLWAVLPSLSATPSAGSFSRISRLTVPTGSGSPKASGTVRLKFMAAQGRSVIDLEANNITPGPDYVITIEDPKGSGLFVAVGDLVQPSRQSKRGSYKRDTKVGDTLPLDSPTASGLSGRLIQLTDTFNQLHLVGAIP